MPKVSALPVATPIDANDVFLVVQDGVTKQITKEVLENSLMTAPLTLIIDEVNATITYIGEAAPNSATSSAVWKIKKLTTTGVDIDIRFAGAGLFTQIWDNRAGLVYL